MARINISQILMKRGNTTAANTYVGPLGELVVDTGLRTIRVQDGVTPGGMSTLATNVQLQALGTYANATFGTSSYGNANVALHLLTSSIIGNINANITAANAAITSLTSNAAIQAQAIANAAGTYGNANVESYIGANIGTLHTNAATQATSINAVNANIGGSQTYANTQVNTVSANLGAYQTFANANSATQATSINSITANLGAYQTFANSNAAAQATSINTVNANLGAYQTYGNLTFSTVANAATQATSIATLQTQVYANANVNTYLSSSVIGSLSTSGNLTVGGNLIVNGNTTVINTATYTIDDNILQIADGNPADSLDLGFVGHRTAGAVLQHTGLVRDASAGNWKLFSNVTAQPGATIDFTNAVYDDLVVGNISANIVKNGYNWNFGTNGTTSFPNSVILAPVSQSITMQSDQYSQLMWENANVTVAPNMAINSNFYVTQNNATLDIGYRDGSSTQLIKSWYWNVDGSLTLPDGGKISDSASYIKLTPAGGANEYQALLIYPTAGDGNHVHLAVPPGGGTELYLGNDLHYVKLVDGGNVQIRTDDLSGNIGTWHFGANANLTLPETGYLRVGSGIVPAFISSPAPIITGFSSISAQNFTFLANGVNILSAIGAYQTFANANAATQATSINTINNTLTSANVGIGLGAGATSQGTSAVAIGEGAGSLDQGLYSVAIGNDAGAQYQGDRSVAVGTGAGRTNQGDYAVAIGRNAGYTNQGNNSIIINATTGTLNQTTANTFTVAPVRNDVANVAQVMFYNTTSKEITYGNVISVAGNINASQFNFANGVNILSTVAGTYSNANVATYLPTYSGNVRALNFVGAVQAQVGSSFAYALNAFGSGSDTGGVFLPADTNSNAVVAGYTIVSNAGVTLTVTSATFIPGSPNFVQVATTPTASSFLYPVTVYSADYSPALPVSTITVGNATISGNVTAPRYLFANGVNILSTVGAGSYGNTEVAAYIPINPTVTALQANIGAYYTFANANAATQATSINSINANIGSYYTFANANLATQTTNINTINANLGAYQTYANANLGTATTNIGALQANIGSFYTYANATYTGGSTYSNTNVAAYLTTATISTTGNVSAGNIITTGATSGNISGANYISANVFQVSTGIFWANGTAWSSTGGGTTYSNANVSAFLAAFGSNTISTTGNITAGNLSITGNIVDTGALSIISGSNGNISLIPNGTGIVSVTGALSATGNITAANIITTGTYGNISGANVITANTLVLGGVTTTRATNGYNTWKGNTYANVDNVSASVFSNGAPAFSSVSGTLNYYWGSVSTLTGDKFFGNTNTGGTVTTSPTVIGTGITLGSGGDTVRLTLQDQDLRRMYTVTYVQTVSAGNCAIIVERIL